MPQGLWTWNRLIQTSGLLSVKLSFLALYTLITILKYSLSHTRPLESLLAHLEYPMLPKMSTLVMHLSQNIDHFVIWYHQPTFKHQESTFIVEVCMILFGKLVITLQGRIVLLSNLDISQPHRTR